MNSGNRLKKTCQEEMSSFSLVCPQLFRELLWVYLDRTFHAGHGNVNSRVKFGQVRRVLGSSLRNLRGGQTVRGDCDPAQLFSGPWETSDDLTLLSSGCFCLFWWQVPGAVRITDLSGMKQQNKSWLLMELPPSINSLLMHAESLKTNP